MRALIGVVRTRRYQFDRVRAEDRQVAYVLVVHLDRERIVRIHLGAVSELMAAQLQAGRSRSLEFVFHLQNASALHPQIAQQVPHAEQHPARVIAGHHDVPIDNLHAERFVSARRGRHPAQSNSRNSGEFRGCPHHNCRRTAGGHGGLHREPHLGPLLNLLHEDCDRRLLLQRQVRRSHYHGTLQVERSQRRTYA